MHVNRKLGAIVSKLDKVDRSVLSLALVGLLCFAHSSAPAAASDRISTFAELYALGPDSLAQGRPVEIKSTVLCFDADWGQLFVESSPTAVFIGPAGLRERFQPGDSVRI